ncbi:hypothetical protein BCM02_113125 [Paenibacillus methanolicus]|uniref:Uncharacterized protein n=1 Tax=Paenibacillus methanolicus TaxID=582686 RepID=A0A5S5BW09_9BACL|nr:hypothetical protein BCM02_113125 [Paenibacillus methanolicus]
MQAIISFTLLNFVTNDIIFVTMHIAKPHVPHYNSRVDGIGRVPERTGREYARLSSQEDSPYFNIETDEAKGPEGS